MVNRFMGIAPRIQGQSEFGQIATELGKMFHNSFGSQTPTPRINRPEGGSLSSSLSQSVTTQTTPRINAAGNFNSTFDAGKFRSFAQSMAQDASGRMSDIAKSMGGASGPVGQPTITNTAADAHNNELASASARFGVPVNVLKVVMIRESSANWERDGARTVGLRGDVIMPFVGIFKNTWNSWGCGPSFEQGIGNKQAQIDCMAKGLSQWYGKAKQTDPSYGWGEVFSMYFSGRYKPIGWADENGLTDTSYVNAAMNQLKQFDAMSGINSLAGGPAGQQPNASTATGISGGISNMSTIWGGKGSKDLSYGFNAPNNLGLYAYGSQYGMDGRGHTGVDIPMAIGEMAYTPVSGTVVCACSGNGSGADGGGCAAFSDVMGQGCGRIEVKLDNGHTVIFGHMSTSNVRVGQRINAGSAIGAAGGMNGGHVHLEYRVPDRSTPSGWRIVDPTGFMSGQALGGAVSDMGAGQPGGMEQIPYNPNTPWAGWKGRSLDQSASFKSGAGAYRPVSSWRM